MVFEHTEHTLCTQSVKQFMFLKKLVDKKKHVYDNKDYINMCQRQRITIHSVLSRVQLYHHCNE